MNDIKLKPALLLLPNLLGEHKHHQIFLPNSVDKAVSTIDGLIAESEQAGRRFLSRFETKKPVAQIPIALLNEHTSESDYEFLLGPIKQGERWGVISDAGLPCIADPGSGLVRHARRQGIAIQAFVGPSSILLGLMLSGMPGQHFSFHGYLERQPKELLNQIRMLEREAKKGYTQIFIEAPYRNMATLQALLEALSPTTKLCVAWELTMPDQGLLSQSVEIWKKSPLPNLEKKNALFLISDC